MWEPQVSYGINNGLMNCAHLSDQSKKNELQWLQNLSQMNAYYVDNVNVTLKDISIKTQD
jgi:hypothetical protein